MKNTKNVLIIAAVVVVAGLSLYFVLTNNSEDSEISLESPSSSATPQTSPSASATPEVKTATPKPGVVSSGVKSYYQWASDLDPLNRHFLLDENCTSIQPSGVDLPNNVIVMLDNSYSSVDRILKIGNKEYNLPAQSWQIVTLKSDTLPAPLPLYCGSMELGRIDLVK